MTLSTDLVVDTFAGPSGWGVALHRLGLPELAIEHDAEACATRAAAGLPGTVRADVAAFPLSGLARLVAEGRRLGLIASPPCQGWSAQGRGKSRGDLDHVLAGLARLAAGGTLDEVRPLCKDPRSLLVTEPLRYALALRPRWVALEQVPEAAPVFAAIAHYLARAGYATWTGILNAADYGVPQTRERVFVIARLDGPAHPPAPTHGRDPEPSLFGDDLAPWVTMADALGWDADEVHRRTDTTAGRTLKPAPMPAGLDRRRWPAQRPATTVTGNYRVACPGYRLPGEPQFGPGHVRLTQAELGVLQGFPPDYPWQGRTLRSLSLQAGNAVPPPVAEAVIRAAAGLPVGVPA